MERTRAMNDPAYGERLASLRLARTEGVGAISYARLIARFGTAGKALAALPELRRRGTWNVGEPCGAAEAEAELREVARIGARLLAGDEPAYPELLRHIADPPPVLAVRGRVEALHGPAVAVIGARNASANGRVIARRLSAELAASGLVVVSGLARGIDTAAHEGALEGGGATVAAVACGVDVAYPPENEGLMARIAAAGGAVVSERPPGAAARAKDFPRRNRIIAGLSLGVVVVEAAPQSGSLITARLAAEQGREVMAVPGSPLDPRHKGTNGLLREGATLVETAADVLAALAPLIARPLPAVSRPRAAEPEWPHSHEPEAPPAPRPESRPAAAAGGSLAAVVEARLGHEPLAVDELVRQCGAARLAEVQDVLLELELDGRLERHPGNRVALRAG
jgi:DNA processing protein